MCESSWCAFFINKPTASVGSVISGGLFSQRTQFVCRVSRNDARRGRVTIYSSVISLKMYGYLGQKFFGGVHETRDVGIEPLPSKKVHQKCTCKTLPLTNTLTNYDEPCTSRVIQSVERQSVPTFDHVREKSCAQTHNNKQQRDQE